MKPEQFISDLNVLRKSLMRPFGNSREYLEPNITHTVLETLIAVFMNKYNITYDDLVAFEMTKEDK